MTLNLIPNHNIIKYRLINYYTITKFANSLLNHSFYHVLTDNNINKSITDFRNTLLHYYSLNCPMKSKTISPKNYFKPWIYQSMKNQMKTHQNYCCYENIVKCQNLNKINLEIL